MEQLPRFDQAINEFPACEDESLELHDVLVVGGSATVADLLEKPELVNVALRRCDIAGFVARGGRAERVLIADGRLRAVSWVAAAMRDVQLDAVEGSDISIRFST